MKKLNKKGFTLIELIVVIAIIAALMLILVPTMNGFVNSAKKQANQANAKAVYTAIVASDTANKAGGMGLTEITNLSTNFCAETPSGTTVVYKEFWSGGKVDNCTFTGSVSGNNLKVTVDGVTYGS